MNNDEIKLTSKKHFESWFVPEPLLVFGDGHTHIDPKLGLTLYGPLKPSNSTVPAPMSIRVGIIGTGETVGLATQFINRLSKKVESSVKESFQNPDFPGFKTVFNCELMQSESYNNLIPESSIHSSTNKPTFDERVDSAANLFVNGIENISERIPKPEVIICALPQEIIDFCVVHRSSTGTVKKKKNKEEEKLIQTFQKHKKNRQGFLDEFDETAEQLLANEIIGGNFWKKIKVNAMKFGIPTQLAWPSTLILRNNLTGRQKRQDDSTIAWNFAVALYYKGSGFPWTMTKMEKDTCYVGITFFRDPNESNGAMRTSLAQIFTYTGEGLVLRGDEFEWDEKQDRSPHLDENSACALLKKAISMYVRQMNQPPTRVVIHKSSKYWPGEKRGFEKALEDIAYHDLITIGSRNIRFFRYGQYPPLRGSVIKLGSKNYILYTKGYIPYLRTYPGAHVPLPLEILEHHGDSPQEKILTEILSLSKMNWNSADFALAKPITLLFSEKVGGVMTSLPKDIVPQHEYRYYM